MSLNGSPSEIEPNGVAVSIVNAEVDEDDEDTIAREEEDVDDDDIDVDDANGVDDDDVGAAVSEMRPKWATDATLNGRAN